MLILDKHRDVLKKFVHIYGSMKQLEMLNEKMAILSASLCRYKRKTDKNITEDERKALEKTCEESLADVIVLVEQAKLIFNESSISMYAEKYITEQKVKLTL